MNSSQTFSVIFSELSTVIHFWYDESYWATECQIWETDELILLEVYNDLYLPIIKCTNFQSFKIAYIPPTFVFDNSA